MDSLGKGFERACKKIDCIYKFIPSSIEEKIKIEIRQESGGPASK